MTRRPGQPTTPKVPRRAAAGGRPQLRALALRMGILPSYRPAGGGAPRATSDATREALLSALGLAADSEAAAARSLEELQAAQPTTPRLEGAPYKRCTTVREVLGRRRSFGLWTNLYTLRSERNLGFGNLSDLRRLVAWAGRCGADFVGVNPLHAIRNRGHEVSPYSPVSRFYRNPLYLDVGEMPELQRCPSAQRLLASPSVREELHRLRAADHLDPERVASLQRRLLAPLHRAFRKQQDARTRAFHRFRARQRLLEDYATFQALEERLASAGYARDWRRWPRELRAHDSPAVEAFRRRHRDLVELHAFVQFELDRQLARAARAARSAGLAVGLYQDLAVGSLASGFDAWRFQDRIVFGASLGAPPDAYARRGQDWGLPPLHPRRMADNDFEIWRGLLRAAFAHAGALRVDHVLGLFRQWWVPAGRPAAEGAYVRFPTGSLLAVLAEESRRQRALVIGEDLGTVPPQVAPTLARYGVLSSRVLLFERDRSGRFRSARRWSHRALATANTHDLPPLAAFWSGSDLDLRRSLGLLRDAAALSRARREREAERRALLYRLEADGHLAPGRDPAPEELTRAVHAFLCSTPCPLVGLSLDDLSGETEPVNVPGVSIERHPSWTRRMRLPAEELPSDPRVQTALRGATRRVRPR